jgi:hypothetical protein
MADSDSESLQNLFTDVGAKELEAEIEEKFSEKLHEEFLFGAPIDGLLDVGTGFRVYDYGQASSKSVQEAGLKIVFNPERTEFQKLTENGEIRKDVVSLATKTLDCPIEYIDLIESTNPRNEYILWIIFDTDTILTE